MLWWWQQDAIEVCTDKCSFFPIYNQLVVSIPQHTTNKVAHRVLTFRNLNKTNEINGKENKNIPCVLVSDYDHFWCIRKYHGNSCKYTQEGPVSLGWIRHALDKLIKLNRQATASQPVSQPVSQPEEFRLTTVPLKMHIAFAPKQIAKHKCKQNIINSKTYIYRYNTVAERRQHFPNPIYQHLVECRIIDTRKKFHTWMRLSLSETISNLNVRSNSSGEWTENFPE